MESSYFPAVVGLTGAVVGGLTSFATTWLAQSIQAREKLQLADLNRRERLYTDFIKEASRLFADALSNQKDDISDLVNLYALAAHIRLVASPATVAAAEGVIRTIIETYGGPNHTLRELQDVAAAGGLDPLIEFSERCRVELRIHKRTP